MGVVDRFVSLKEASSVCSILHVLCVLRIQVAGLLALLVGAAGHLRTPLHSLVLHNVPRRRGILHVREKPVLAQSLRRHLVELLLALVEQDASLALMVGGHALWQNVWRGGSAWQEGLALGVVGQMVLVVEVDQLALDIIIVRAGLRLPRVLVRVVLAHSGPATTAIVVRRPDQLAG